MTYVSSRYEVSANGIADMSISDGLKEALVKCGFIDRHQILSYTTGELASILEIDQYVAKLILEAERSCSDFFKSRLYKNNSLPTIVYYILLVCIEN